MINYKHNAHIRCGSRVSDKNRRMLHALLDVQHFSELRRRPAPPADGKQGKCAMVAWPSSLLPSPKLELAHEQKQVALLDGVLYSLLQALNRKVRIVA